MTDECPERPKTGRTTAAIKSALVAFMRKTGKVRPVLEKHDMSLGEVKELLKRDKAGGDQRATRKRRKK